MRDIKDLPEPVVELRAKIYEMSKLIVTEGVPLSAELSQAIVRLKEFEMWAIAGLMNDLAS